MKPDEVSVFPVGGKNEAFAKYFVGQSHLNMLTTEGVTIGNVTFSQKVTVSLIFFRRTIYTIQVNSFIDNCFVIKVY